MICNVISDNLDALYWTPKDVFYSKFCQLDFVENRACKEVHNVYLLDWFVQEADKTLFLAPAIRVTNLGETRFLNGRHRTAVLLNYVDIIPIGYVEGAIGNYYLDAKFFAEDLGLKPILENDVFHIPDLPIQNEI